MTFKGLVNGGRVMSLALALSGCVLSIDPVITESDAIFDPRLLGTWEEVGGGDRAVVSRAAGNRYTIEYTSDEKIGKLEARLGRLGERLVLDVWPAPRDTRVFEPYTGLLIRGHALVALDLGVDEIRTAILDRDSLLAADRAGNVRLGYARSGDQVILSGTTEEMRSALRRYLTRSGALAKPGVWRRASAAVTPSGLR